MHSPRVKDDVLRAALATACKTIVLLSPCTLWALAIVVRPEASLRLLFASTILASVALLGVELSQRSRSLLWRRLRLPAVAVVVALNVASFHWGRYPSTPIVD